MNRTTPIQPLLIILLLLLIPHLSIAQKSTGLLKPRKSTIFAGIEVGAKGIKMSIVQIEKKPSTKARYSLLRDTSINTDFIAFTTPTFNATVQGMLDLYATATQEFGLLPNKIFTVVSSGVKTQADKENKNTWVHQLIDSFKIAINEPERKVELVSVPQEARLSHLGIMPEKERYSTFLIDIGSGNTKGGFFSDSSSKAFKLFQMNWGTKSTTYAIQKKLVEDKSITAFIQQYKQTIAELEKKDIVYAVNTSGSYRVADNIVFSGGAAWALANLIQPKKINEPVVKVTYAEVAGFLETLMYNYPSLSDAALMANIEEEVMNANEQLVASNTIKTVHKVFDQPSLIAGVGLLLKIMRQFESSQSKKQFYLVKNGQVGWISAYVSENK
jgi:hypothetical protein